MSAEGLVTDTLNLPGVTTIKHVSSDGQHTYEARGTSPAPLGPCCLLFDPSKGRAGTQWRMFTDTTRDGQPAIIHYKLQKWKCAGCGKTPQEHLPWAEPGHGFTERAAKVVFDKAIRQSFTSVANEFGTDPKTVADPPFISRPGWDLATDGLHDIDKRIDGMTRPLSAALLDGHDGAELRVQRGDHSPPVRGLVDRDRRVLR